MTIRLLTEHDFETFFRSEYRRLVALASTLTGSLAYGEDLAQEALSRAFARWEQLAGYDNAGTWVRRVVINLAIDAGRRRGRERLATERLGSPPPLLPADPPSDSFWAAVRALPDRQRAVVALYCLEDRAVAEVAAVLEVSEGTVKTSLSRARQHLARTLEVGE